MLPNLTAQSVGQSDCRACELVHAFGVLRRFTSAEAMASHVRHVTIGQAAHGKRGLCLWGERGVAETEREGKIGDSVKGTFNLKTNQSKQTFPIVLQNPVSFPAFNGVGFSMVVFTKTATAAAACTFFISSTQSHAFYAVQQKLKIEPTWSAPESNGKWKMTTKYGKNARR